MLQSLENMSVCTNLMVIRPIIIAIFQSRPKYWKYCQTDITVPKALSLTYLKMSSINVISSVNHKHALLYFFLQKYFIYNPSLTFNSQCIQILWDVCPTFKYIHLNVNETICVYSIYKIDHQYNTSLSSASD